MIIYAKKEYQYFGHFLSNYTKYWVCRFLKRLVFACYFNNKKYNILPFNFQIFLRFTTTPYTVVHWILQFVIKSVKKYYLFFIFIHLFTYFWKKQQQIILYIFIPFSYFLKYTNADWFETFHTKFTAMLEK